MEKAPVSSSSAALPLNAGTAASSSSATLMRGLGDFGKAIEAKMDSISASLSSAKASNSDSIAKVKADSVRAAIQAGSYVPRAQYDKSNFDSWKIDTVYQKSMKERVAGTWRTPILSHGHAFRDAELNFLGNALPTSSPGKCSRIAVSSVGMLSISEVKTKNFSTIWSKSNSGT